MTAEPLIVIPARLSSQRLPNKPLKMIGDAPMIVHVWRRAMEAKLGRVLVACDDASIQEAVQAAGGEAVLTRADHASGSDRIWEAVQQIDPGAQHPIIINLQGDLPLIDPQLLQKVGEILQARPHADIATLAVEITDEEEKTNPNVVKPILSFYGEGRAQALYFTRAAAPYGDGPLYHHVGIYGYRRDALARFVALPPSALELRERLEQLRALEAGMRIDVVLASSMPLGVDTQEDLDKVRSMYEQ